MFFSSSRPTKAPSTDGRSCGPGRAFQALNPSLFLGDDAVSITHVTRAVCHSVGDLRHKASLMEGDLRGQCPRRRAAPSLSAPSVTVPSSREHTPSRLLARGPEHNTRHVARKPWAR